MAEKSVHEGHRARMRQKFADQGGKCFLDHEILELLLYYALPRKDTNETAHRLIEEFGSLEKLLDADPEQICRVAGVNRNTAVFLGVIREIAARYAALKLREDDSDPVFDTPEKIAAFLRPKYLGVTVERVYLLLFDNSMKLLDCRHLGDGDVSSVLISVRQIAEYVYRKNAASVVLSHNHPDGLAVPSGADITLTHQLVRALSLLDIPLMEHFIFSKYSYCTILHDPPREEEPGLAAAPSGYQPVLKKGKRYESIDKTGEQDQ